LAGQLMVAVSARGATVTVADADAVLLFASVAVTEIVWAPLTL
jgi:hypothetical protein